MPFLMAPCCAGEGERDLASRFSQKVQESGGLAVRCLLDSSAFIIFCMQMPAHSRRRGKDGRDTVVGSNFVVLSSCGFYSEERKGSQSIAGLWTFPCLLLRACPSASAGPGGASGLAVSRGLSEGSAAVSCAAQTCHGFLFFLSFQFLCNRAGPRRGQRSRGAASRCRFQGGERGLTPAARPFPRLPAPRPPARPPPLCRPHPARQVSEP